MVKTFAQHVENVFVTFLVLFKTYNIWNSQWYQDSMHAHQTTRKYSITESCIYNKLSRENIQWQFWTVSPWTVRYIWNELLLVIAYFMPLKITFRLHISVIKNYLYDILSMLIDSFLFCLVSLLCAWVLNNMSYLSLELNFDKMRVYIFAWL